MAETSVSVSELKGLSKPLCKLIEAVQAAIGLVYQPFHIRRIAKAQADATIIQAKAEAEACLVKSNAEAESVIVGAEADSKASDIAYRAKARIENKEIRQQKNIESIVNKAIDYMPSEVSDAKWSIS